MRTSLSNSLWLALAAVTWLGLNALVMAPSVGLAFAIALAGTAVAVVDGPRS